MLHKLTTVGAISAIALALSYTAHAQSNFKIEPGKWKSDMTMETTMVAHGMTMKQPKQTMSHEYCVTAEEASFSPEDFAKKISQNPDMKNVDCDISDLQANHPHLKYTMRCSMAGTEMVMINEFTIGSDGKSGTGKGSNSFEKDGMSMKSTSTNVQTHIGDC